MAHPMTFSDGFHMFEEVPIYCKDGVVLYGIKIDPKTEKPIIVYVMAYNRTEKLWRHVTPKRGGLYDYRREGTLLFATKREMEYILKKQKDEILNK